MAQGLISASRFHVPFSMPSLIDRFVERSLVRRFLVSFEKADWPDTLQSLAVLGVRALLDHYGNTTHLVDAPCLIELARSLEFSDCWPDKLAVSRRSAPRNSKSCGTERGRREARQPTSAASARVGARSGVRSNSTRRSCRSVSLRSRCRCNSAPVWAARVAAASLSAARRQRSREPPGCLLNPEGNSMLPGVSQTQNQIEPEWYTRLMQRIGQLNSGGIAAKPNPQEHPQEQQKPHQLQQQHLDGSCPVLCEVGCEHVASTVPPAPSVISGRNVPKREPPKLGVVGQGAGHTTSGPGALNKVERRSHGVSVVETTEAACTGLAPSIPKAASHVAALPVQARARALLSDLKGGSDPCKLAGDTFPQLPSRDERRRRLQLLIASKFDSACREVCPETDVR
uniref:Uncharacterized protein n=1 Tax=Noctiluca scintillans TaxID=2966 RepID=A0A7S1AH40_NOCSC